MLFLKSSRANVSPEKISRFQIATGDYGFLVNKQCGSRGVNFEHNQWVTPGWVVFVLKILNPRSFWLDLSNLYEK